MSRRGLAKAVARCLSVGALSALLAISCPLGPVSAYASVAASTASQEVGSSSTFIAESNIGEDEYYADSADVDMADGSSQDAEGDAAVPVAPSGDSEEEGGESAQGSTGENGVTGVQPGDDGDGSQDVANPEADSDSDPSAPEPDNGEGDSGQYPPDQDSGIGESGGSALDGFTDAAGQLTSDAGLDESADEGSVEEETEGAGIESESLESAPTEASTLTPELSYAAHVSNIGWQNPVANGVQAGTTGRALAVEALRFTLKGAPVSDLVIRAHISDLGWQQEVSSDKVVGTTGQAKSIEALNIKLKGELGAQYDVWYRVHVANFGWLGWTSNGQNAGSVGYGNAVEAVQIKLVKKGEGIDGSTSTPFKDRADEPPSVVYRAHVRNIGWKENVSNGATAGTTGRALPVEAVSASISWYGHSGTVSVRAHVQDIGWQNWSTGTGGTTGRAKHIEAIQLRLSGEVANDWDIWYRVHAANIGWMGWTCNGAAAGTTGKNYAVEAVQIKLVKKGGSAPGPTANSYAGVSESLASVAYGVTGSSVSVSGSNPLSIGSTTGGNALQSFSLVVNNQIRTGTVEYRVRRQFGSWEGSWHANGAQTSSSRDGQQIEGVQIKLSGELSTAYDVWYRVNTASWGWSGWGCNGTSVGSEGSASGVRGLQVQLVKKGSGAPGSISNAYRKNSGSPALVYQAHSRDIGWQALVPSGKTAGTTGKAKSIEALRVGFSGSVSGSVEVSAHVSNIGWQGFVGTGALAGTTGRALSVEAVKIKLSGAVASQYDVVYRVHSSEYGWLGWARNGSVAGTTGLNRPIEAIEVKLVAKGASTPSSSVPAYIPAPAVSYQSYLSSGGWQKAVSNGVLSGTTGQARAITGVRVTYGSASQVPGDVSYSVHVQDIGWMSDVYSGKDAGSQAKDKQIEAIKIKLTGQAATYYDIWYRAYVENYGWLGWTKNGGQAGTGTIGYRMEAFQVVIKAKGSAAPGSTANAYRDKPYSVNAALLNVPCLMQYPELPTGCESVALTNVLNYYGYGLAKSTIADSYLPRSSSNFVTAFWGNPHSSSGNCTSAPGIVNAANSFLSQHGGARHAYDVSGVSLEGMYSHLQNGNPVIVWSTIRQANIGAVYARQWYNGKQYFTVTNSHTVVLRGFDRARNVVYLSDSISGYVTMDASRFYLLYSLRGSQAVVVR